MTTLPRTELGNTILDLLPVYERFAESLIAAAGDERREFRARLLPLAPVESSDIERYAREFSFDVPADVAAFWRRGTFELSVYPRQKVDGIFYHGGIDFCELEKLPPATLENFDLAENYDETDAAQSEIARLHRRGVPLSFTEPFFIVDAEPASAARGGVHRLLYDGDPLVALVAASFTEFFEHWLAAGCFMSHDFAAYWRAVKEFVLIEIPLEENLWLRFYDQQYETRFAVREERPARQSNE